MGRGEGALDKAAAAYSPINQVGGWGSGVEEGLSVGCSSR
jgi:hypothetical protein